MANSIQSVKLSLADTEPSDQIRLSGRHIGVLDGVRGIAVLLVLIFHYARSAGSFGLYHPIQRLTEFGWIGVDLFFVLSGFLITGLLYESRGSSHYLRNFYAKRMLRIFPLYYLVLLIVLILSAVWPSAGVWPSFSLFWFGIYATNVLMAVGEDGGLLGHFWTLAVEEHFYLVWPLILLLGDRKQLMKLLAVVIAAALALRIFLVLSNVGTEMAYYVLTPTRGDSLAVGAFFSLALRGPQGIAPVLRWAQLIFPLCGAGLTLIILWTGELAPLNPIVQTVGYSLIAGACGSGIVLALGWRPFKVLIDVSVFRWFGKYSYGLYVWHVVVNVLLFHTPLKDYLGIVGAVWGGVYLTCALVLTFGVSLLSYHFLERPFLDLRSRLS